jgi:hypothetical protein
VTTPNFKANALSDPPCQTGVPEHSVYLLAWVPAVGNERQAHRGMVTKQDCTTPTASRNAFAIRFTGGGPLSAQGSCRVA